MSIKSSPTSVVLPAAGTAFGGFVVGTTIGFVQCKMNFRRSKWKVFTVVTALAFGCGGLMGALAADRIIGQKGKMFSETEVIVKVGEALVYVNDDNVTHNVQSTSAGNEFNIGSQEPGASTPVTFKAAGDVKVICAIHPRMQMTVKVLK
jgi:plastocyanin